MGRPIGARLIEAVTILETIGPARSREVGNRMSGLNRDNAVKYLDRAQQRGWVVVTGELYKRVYTVVPGWQNKIADYAMGVRELPPAPPVRQHHLQQVWR